MNKTANIFNTVMIQMGLTEYGTLSIINRQKEQTDIEKLTKEEY